MPSRVVVSRFISTVLASSRPVTSCHVMSGLVCSLPHWFFALRKGWGRGGGLECLKGKEGLHKIVEKWVTI